MKRMVLGGIVGGLVYYLWGMAAWMVVDLHANTLQPLPMDLEVTAALTEAEIGTGVYASPMPADPADATNTESSFYKSHLAGPNYMVYYNADGAEPMSTQMMVGGLVIAILAGLLAACFLTSTLRESPSYMKRVGFVVGLGLFVVLVSHVAEWNWMRVPTGYTVNFIIDNVIGWTLAGLAIAAIVKPCDSQTSSGASQLAAAAVAAPAVAAQPKPDPKPVAPPKPARNDAITLLATLQREARFIDIVKEPLNDYTDAQIGAAARDVLRDCGAVLERLFDLQPIVDQEEGSNIDVPAGFDAGRFRVTGNVAGEAPYNGPLVHHGWEAKKCSLPQWTGSSDAAKIVAPAELEIK